jgi:hypothetical protein
MATEADGWTIIDEDGGILTRTYRFAPGAWARTLVARFKADELLVMSPPTGLDDASYRALERFGKVTALVAPNGFHHLGLAPWKQAFPDCRIFASDKALARIRKKQPTLSNLEPLSELSKNVQPGVELCDLPFFSIGEAWLKAPSKAGQVWYVSDSCFNFPELPKAFVPRLLLKWTGSAPGFRINGLGNLIFLRDKRGYKAWFLDQLRKDAPSIVVSAHGDVLDQPKLRETMIEMAERAL